MEEQKEVPGLERFRADYAAAAARLDADLARAQAQYHESCAYAHRQRVDALEAAAAQLVTTLARQRPEDA